MRLWSRGCGGSGSRSWPGWTPPATAAARRQGLLISPGQLAAALSVGAPSTAARPALRRPRSATARSAPSCRLQGTRIQRRQAACSVGGAGVAGPVPFGDAVPAGRGAVVSAQPQQRRLLALAEHGEGHRSAGFVPAKGRVCACRSAYGQPGRRPWRPGVEHL
ncbi:hypothetical protein COO60DRAFT_87809 [Scenedesmus sp. NREL 46B-D3]|nr:hypothetical protein COO60DRAFT_87809 [Scenedesmus sp. NREL 46B-D3]